VGGWLIVGLWGSESGRGGRRCVRLLVSRIGGASLRRLLGRHRLYLRRGGGIAATAASSVLLGSQFSCFVFG